MGQDQQDMLETKARLAGRANEEYSGNTDKTEPERKARLAGMTNKGNAGSVCKVESESDGFAIVAPKGSYS
ncbi:hypothetical protein [Oceanithermus sp.]